MNRPALTRLLTDIDAGLVDLVLAYKVDRLSRALTGFARLIERFDQQGISFVSVTQQFNTSTSMGRLTLNVLLSFAQFEREVTGERIRDKIAASKVKGMWMGGVVPLGYDRVDKQLVVNDQEADLANHIFARYLALGNVRDLKVELDRQGLHGKERPGRHPGNKPFSRGALYALLSNVLYTGKIAHKDKLYPGLHRGIIDNGHWQAVQKQLRQNRITRKQRGGCKAISLLAGKLLDDAGNVMSPSHSKKGNTRYRYYISQALLHFRSNTAGSVIRVPASKLEAVVIEGIAGLYSQPQALMDIHPPGPVLSAAEQQHLLQGAEDLAGSLTLYSSQRQLALLSECLEKVVVYKDRLEVTLSCTGLLRTVGIEIPGEYEDQFHRLLLPVVLKRTGIESSFVVPGGPPPVAHSTSVKALRQAMHQALTWNQLLSTGKATSLADIARQNNINPTYVGRILQLAFLAPDIITRIIQGKVPEHLTLERLKSIDLPLDWQEQRQLFNLA